MEENEQVITIDGPAGAGKSTVARAVARALGWLYLDTGAMYRAVAVAVERSGINPLDENALKQLLNDLELEIAPGSEKTGVFLNRVDITEEIRQPHISAKASSVSALKPVRETMVSLQRKIGSTGRIVAEGRDMGTVVFPKARVKIFLTASDEERARRRLAEFKGKNEQISFEQVLHDMRARDVADSSRALSPLRPAENAVIFDTTALNIDQVAARLLEIIHKRLKVD